ncbi:MAG: hypothetical protein WD877_00895 [Candidatus Saccharimonadales bacterium]
MREILLPPEDINADVSDYGQNLRSFAETYDIPRGLLAEPDHMVIKSADPVDFADKARAIRPWTEEERIVFMEVNSRFLVAAEVITPWAVGHNWVNWLEIMEPRQEVGRDFIGLEYAQFYYSDIDYAGILLNSRNLEVEFYTDEGRNWRWLNVKINQVGQEFRLSDTKLVEIIGVELEDGTARLI